MAAVVSNVGLDDNVDFDDDELAGLVDDDDDDDDDSQDEYELEANTEAHYAAFKETQRMRKAQRAAMSAQPTFVRPSSPKSATQRSREEERASWRRPQSAEASSPMVRPKSAAPKKGQVLQQTQLHAVQAASSTATGDDDGRVEFRGGRVTLLAEQQQQGLPFSDQHDDAAGPAEAEAEAAAPLASDDAVPYVPDARTFAASLSRNDAAIASAVQARRGKKPTTTTGRRRRAAEPALMAHGIARAGGFAFGPATRQRPASAHAASRQPAARQADDGVARAQKRVVEEKKRRRRDAETATTAHRRRGPDASAMGADVAALSWQDALAEELPLKVREANDWSRAIGLRSRYRVAAAAYGRAVFVERTVVRGGADRAGGASSPPPAADPMAPSDFARIHGRLRQQARASARFARRADEDVPSSLATAYRFTTTPTSTIATPAPSHPHRFSAAATTTTTTTTAAPAHASTSTPPPPPPQNSAMSDADVTQLRDAIARLIVDTADGRHRMQAQAEALTFAM